MGTIERVDPRVQPCDSRFVPRGELRLIETDFTDEILAPDVWNLFSQI
jgi:hypothetical protein